MHQCAGAQCRAVQWHAAARLLLATQRSAGAGRSGSSIAERKVAVGIPAAAQRQGQGGEAREANVEQLLWSLRQVSKHTVAARVEEVSCSRASPYGERRRDPTQTHQLLSTPKPQTVESPSYCLMAGDDQPPKLEKSELHEQGETEAHADQQRKRA